MKLGDRVTVIANNEWHGRSGFIVDLTPKGDLIIALEVKAVTWNATFKPHEVELAELVKDW